MANASSGSYKLLVKVQDELKCMKCQQVAVEPWQHWKCGKLFCKQCLEKHGQDQPCPGCGSCGTEPVPKYFEDNRSKKNIDALHVKCTNSDGSVTCNWIGRFCGLQEHSAVCSYALVPCPNSCKDDNGVVKCFNTSALFDHKNVECPNRDHTCQDCGEKGTYSNITLEHNKVCKKKLVPCPNEECSSQVQRRGVKRHLETCTYVDVPCKYAKLGCGTMMKRRTANEHERDDSLHLHMAVDTVVWLEKEIELLKKRGGLMLKNGESVTFKMTKYQQKKDAKEVFSAPSFSSSGGHHFVVQVYANGSGVGIAGEHLSVVTQMSGESFNNGTITVQLLNQLADDNHQSKTGRSIVKFIASNKLDLNSTKKTQYLKDDTLYFKVTINIPNLKSWLECTAT